MNVPAPSWIHWTAGIVCLAGLAGLAVLAVRVRFVKLVAFQRAAISLLCLAALAQEVYLVALITRCDASCYQGRYLFPAVGPLMVLVSTGLVGLLPRQHRPALASGLVLVFAGMAIYAPFRVIRPAYQIVPLPKWSLWLVPHRTDIMVGTTFELKGYRLRSETNRRTISVSLYWQATEVPNLDYSVFVHLIDESEQLVSQKDHAPGEDRGYPPTSWSRGDIVEDKHIIDIPPEVGPGTYRLRVGVYDWTTGRRLPVLSEGEPMGDFIILDQAVRWRQS